MSRPIIINIDDWRTLSDDARNAWSVLLETLGHRLDDVYQFVVGHKSIWVWAHLRDEHGSKYVDGDEVAWTLHETHLCECGSSSCTHRPGDWQ